MSIAFLKSSLMAALGVLMPAAAGLAQTPPSYADVAPLFAAHCVMCHSGEGAPMALRLDGLAAIKAGSSRGPVVQAGQAENSELIRRLRGTSMPHMPLTGPPWLSGQDIARVASWIDAGMPAASWAGHRKA